MQSVRPSSSRLAYLDGVRAFALILGIIFHASLSFMPIFIGWAVMDINTSDNIGAFVVVSHSFRMELFFLIAGYLSCLSVSKHGVKHFFKLRLIRIGIPFIVGWILLRPLIISGWAMGGQSMSGDVDIWAGLLNGLDSFNGQDILVGTHLWFLYYLLIISGSALSLRWLISANSRINTTVVGRVDKLVNWLVNTPFIKVLLVLPITACLWFMNGWGVDTPDKSLWPMWPVFFLYGGFFSFGWLLARTKENLDKLTSFSGWLVVICIVSIVTVLMLSRYEMQGAHDYYTWIKLGYLFSYALMMCSLVSITMAVFRAVMSKSAAFIRYLADASYWLYLIHLPIVVWLQIAVAELPWHWSLKWGAICTLTVILSLLIYDLLVRATFIGALLNGKRQASTILQTQAIIFSKKS
ncbi:MAG: hypothetical protein BM565_06015 [Gammaproteobacteria bacterium MedPE]|nr:MAG: hypothetical protein BM565_06015 [Gammaproteobacteria bacterium MedPE]